MLHAVGVRIKQHGTMHDVAVVHVIKGIAAHLTATFKHNVIAS